jgi:hypothetical protein
VAKKKVRRRKYKKRKIYFTKEHENAIVEYALSQSQQVRTKLYIEYIRPVFNEMVDKIVYTYRFTNLPNIDCLKDECKVWLTTILDKFDPNKGTKAFSYFSVITKNWFIHKAKKTAHQNKREVQYDQIPRSTTDSKMITYNYYHEIREKKEFWEFLWVEIECWSQGELRPNEKKVLEAVKILLSSSDSIEIFNKKAIYLYLREITGLNTKQIVNNLNKVRVKYKNFKKKWDEGEI